jgi:hypothetical protein
MKIPFGPYRDYQGIHILSKEGDGFWSILFITMASLLR